MARQWRIEYPGAIYHVMSRCITTLITLFFFLSTFYLVPCAQAVDTAVKADLARNQYHPQGRTDEEKLSNTLQAIKEHVTERKAHLRDRLKQEA